MLRGGLPGARWIDPENYHLTLRFIGDVDDMIAHEVASMLGRVKRGAFELHLKALDVVRRPQAARGRRERCASAGLDGLQAEHERLMQRIGLEPEGRKYTPHVTLARLRESSSREVAEYLSARGLFPHVAVPCVALRVVFLARLGRRRPLRGRGELSAQLKSFRSALRPREFDEQWDLILEVSFRRLPERRRITPA